MAKRILFVLLIAGLAVALNLMGTINSDLGQARQKPYTHTETVKIPVERTVWNPCPMEGEWVDFSGTGHAVIHITDSIDEEDGSGLWNMVFIQHPSNMVGIGQMTGTTYIDAGGGIHYHEVDNLKGAYTINFQQKARMIAKGKKIPGEVESFMLYFQFHATVNAQGVLTAWMDDFRVNECKWWKGKGGK